MSCFLKFSFWCHYHIFEITSHFCSCVSSLLTSTRVFLLDTSSTGPECMIYLFVLLPYFIRYHSSPQKTLYPSVKDLNPTMGKELTDLYQLDLGSIVVHVLPSFPKGVPLKYHYPHITSVPSRQPVQKVGRT